MQVMGMLANLHLPSSGIVAFGSDGASNLTGKDRGAIVRTLEHTVSVLLLSTCSSVGADDLCHPRRAWGRTPFPTPRPLLLASPGPLHRLRHQGHGPHHRKDEK